ncbi:TraU family protein [Marinomonas algarum]|uniref:TraU family protein n=1 Tax=Marinomonas algarum TaxID=2883105 RepID=A0A9X1INF3_9GAMM|nr:TraU family protein [Marinomonas algarum]
MNKFLSSSLKVSLFALLCLGGSLVKAESADTEGSGCQNAEVIGPKMLTDICWSCIFPLRVAGVDVSGSGRMPSGAVKSPLCLCEDNQGVSRPGVTTSMWEPARVVEFQRVPGCSSVLNGTRFPFDITNQGQHGEGEQDDSDASFTHYHYYSFPLLQMLDMFVKQSCNPDGFTDLDIMYLSELDPTWNNDQLAFFTSPEASAVANPVATLACTADAVSSALGRPIDRLFWCAGSWGNIYPLSGRQTGGKGTIRDTSLLSARVLGSLHRRGLAYGTVGDQAMCGGNLMPTLPKSQYKFTMLHPVPETESAHVIGESTLTWGFSRTIPAVGEDPIYVIWRWNDCCNT